MGQNMSPINRYSHAMYFTFLATPTNSCTFTSIRLFLHTIFEIVCFSFNGYTHSQRWRRYDKLILKNERNVLYSFWWGRSSFVQGVEFQAENQLFKPLSLALCYKSQDNKLSLRRYVRRNTAYPFRFTSVWTGQTPDHQSWSTHLILKTQATEQPSRQKTGSDPGNV